MEMKNLVKQNNKKAFTLIEALVAISILMIAIASPMQLAQKGLSTASLAKDQMIAGFYAQGVIESVKGIRDEIALNNTTGDWLNGTVLNNCICEDNKNNCNFDNPANLKFCTIDTTSAIWNSDSIKPGTVQTAILKATFNVTQDQKKLFLKYDYNPKSYPSCLGFSGPGMCSEDTKFTVYTNVRKTGFLHGDEAEISVLVFWDSPLGRQGKPISDFIYNLSENL